MAVRVMTSRGAELLQMYPPFLRDEQTLQAVCNAIGPEFDLLDQAIAILENGLTAASATDTLFLFEVMLGMTPRPVGVTLAVRTQNVITFMSRAVMSARGIDWEGLVTLLLGQGWRYTVGGVNFSELTVYIPFGAANIKAQLAAALLRSVTPATMTIVVLYDQGFILDRTLLK